MEKGSHYFKFFDYFLFFGVVLTSLAMGIIPHHAGWNDFFSNFDWLNFIGVVFGIVNIILCAKGNVFNYVFGIIYNSIYLFTAFKTSLYADAAIFAFYYLPMQFVGWVNWKKNSSGDTVRARHINKKMIFILLAVAAILIPFIAFILSRPFIGDSQPWIDGATTVASIIAMYLMVKAITEQWYIWVVLDVLMVIKWSIATAAGEDYAVMWLIMFSFYLANAVDGLIQWSKLAEKTE